MYNIIYIPMFFLDIFVWVTGYIYYLNHLMNNHYKSFIIIIQFTNRISKKHEIHNFRYYLQFVFKYFVTCIIYFLNYNNNNKNKILFINLFIQKYFY